MIRAVVVMAVMSISSAALAQSDSNTGLHGVLHVASTGEVASGAVVIATSPALQGEQVVVADDHGRYAFAALPPGIYTLTIYYDNKTASETVVMHAGPDIVADFQLTLVEQPAGVHISIDERLMIDEGSTRTGMLIEPDFTSSVPLGRTFGDVIRVAPGAQLDAYGTSFSGATSVENVYLIDGLDTTDTGFGRLSSNLPNEFIQLTEVMTGGYGAEYGHATGGLVNVVTKQGSNDFHGSVFAYYTPGSLASGATTIERSGGSIDTRQDLDRAYDIGTEVGGPVIKDKLWFHVGFDPSVQRTVTTRLVQSQVDKVNNLTGATGGDGIPDVDPSTGVQLHAPVSSSTLPEHRTTYFFTAKLDGAIDPEHQFELAVSGNPSSGDADNLTGPITFAPGDDVFHTSDGAYDARASYTGRLLDGRTRIDVLAGFHRGYSTTMPVNDQQRLPLTEYHYPRNLTDFEDLEGAAIAPAIGGNVHDTCNDSDPADPYPKIANCPVVDYAEAGLGLIEKRINDRMSASVAVTQLARLAGDHTLKAGVELDTTSYVSDQSFTGGSILRRAASGTWRLQRFVSDAPISPISDQLTPLDSIHIDSADRSLGAYAQDAWQIVQNLTVTGGLRFDQQAIGIAKGIAGTQTNDNETVPDAAVTLDNWAPRLGVIYDPTREGRSKLFAHWGRYFENVPMDINVRAFAGATEEGDEYNSQHTIDPACNVDHAAGVIPSQVLTGCTDVVRTQLTSDGLPEYVAPGLRGQHVDELVLGGEYELASWLRASLTYTHRNIGDVIEDMSSDGGNTLVIANPGRNYASDADALDAQAAQVKSMNPVLAAELQQHAHTLDWLAHYDAPSRNYDAVTLRVDLHPIVHSLVTATYTYSALRGNYPGLFSTETNQLDPNITSQYDLPDLMANRYGPLGLDRPHHVEVDGFYRFEVGGHEALTTGASLHAQSGIAHNALGGQPIYGEGETYLLPRGSIARSPFVTQLDIHVGYGRHLTSTTFFEVFADVFNVFDQQDELNVDENYTFDSTEPIVGGDAGDLAHLKNHHGDSTGLQGRDTVTPNKNFDHTSVQTSPRTVRLGARLTF